MEFYYTPSENIFESENRLYLRDFEFKHLAKVLRKKTGDTVFITDGKKNIYQCIITEIGRNEIVCAIEKKETDLNEPEINLTLCLSLLRNMTRFEFALEKAVELGVNSVIPVMTQFTVSKNEFSGNKRERFEKIIISAMGQSQRCFKPVLKKTLSLNELNELCRDEKNKIVLYEFSEDTDKYKFDISSDKVILLTGPEGGFSKEEIQILKNSNWQIKSLGKRKLRAETAAIAALSQILIK
ncbi:MAG TPA: RsmE family RNA methyltransferase [Ignavibacteria bacterium]|nr:RsmE family RNA methyltransferase [Ignavibacteria bacterium]HRK00156.1 RsmE family RNA methyltransferase [Ignavibacteria bacterium]